MNKYIFLIIFFITVLGLTSCSDNSLSGSESAWASAEQEFAAVTDEEKNTETFSDFATSETTASFYGGAHSNIESGTNITEADESTAYEEITEAVNTEADLDNLTETNAGCFDNITYEFTAVPAAADVKDYADKEIAAMAVFIVGRSEMEEYREYYSALIVYTDGACAAGVFKSDGGPVGFLGNFNTVYDAGEIICFDVIGTIDQDISELLNESLNLIDIDSEWNYYHGYKPYDPDEPEAYPAVVEVYDYDLVHFMDNEVNIFSSYEVKPLEKFEDAVLYAELDDNYAKECRDFFIRSGIADYWLENYAQKIGG